MTNPNFPSPDDVEIALAAERDAQARRDMHAQQQPGFNPFRRLVGGVVSVHLENELHRSQEHLDLVVQLDALRRGVPPIDD